MFRHLPEFTHAAGPVCRSSYLYSHKLNMYIIQCEAG